MVSSLISACFIVICVLNVSKGAESDIVKLDHDYCDGTYADLCKSVGNHVGCKAKLTYSEKCPKTTTKLLTSDEIKDRFVYYHNFYRNQIAKGEAKGLGSNLPPANKMATIEWDEELATLAKLNVLTCAFEHDKCRATKNFRQPGQSLAFSVSSNPSTETLIKSSVDMWYNEVKDVKADYVDKFPKDMTIFPKIGHFAVFAVDKVSKIGCAIVTFPSSTHEGLTTMNSACNYNSIFMFDKPLYIKKGNGGKGCANGSNEKFPALCSTKEIFDPNWF